jgi:hypothetical protein
MPHSHLRLLVSFCCVYFVNGSFTLPTFYGENVIQQNGNKTWCFYPAVDQTRAVSCTDDYAAVSLVHLNTTIAIGYYAPDNTRYGGAEWPVPVNGGRVTLCVSGQAADATYLTACAFVTSDNSLPATANTGFFAGCMIAIGQTIVTDGCYLPGQLALSSSLESTATPVTATTSPSIAVQSNSMRKLHHVISAGMFV